MFDHRTRIKICGITRAEDAAAAVSAGADALGVVFAPSSRRIGVAQAAAALAEIPATVARVGVFVDAPATEIEIAVRDCALTAVQLCGDESPELCASLPVPVIKVFQVAADFDSAVLEPYRGAVRALLFDASVMGQAGGTGRVFDWHALGGLPDWVPSIIAGGLKASNVQACIAALRPCAVDVSSGVETSPGVKDARKMLAFCSAVRAADDTNRKETR